jgi:hypothetical protein
MNQTYKFWILFIVAIALGMMIGYIDSGPHWDDAGITVAMIIIASSILGFVMPHRAWVWALSVGIWIPIWNIVLNNNYSAFISIVIAFAGAYMGVLIHKLFFSDSSLS